MDGRTISHRAEGDGNWAKQWDGSGREGRTSCHVTFKFTLPSIGKLRREHRRLTHQVGEHHRATRPTSTSSRQSALDTVVSPLKRKPKDKLTAFSSFLSRPLDVISFPLQQIFSSNRTTIGRINTNNVASVVWLLAFSSRVEAGEREGKAVHKNKWINFSIHYDDALSSVDLFLLTRCRK